MTKKPDLDEPTLKILKRMLSMPPKPHDQMKVGKTVGGKTKPKRPQTKTAGRKDG